MVEMNVASQQFADTSMHAGLPNRVPPAAWPTSLNGSRIYLGHQMTTSASRTTGFIWIMAGYRIGGPHLR